MSDRAAPGPRLLALWEKLHRLPGGDRVFSHVLGTLVPYSGTVGARVAALEPGRAVVRLRDRRKVRNHLGSVHAVALVNLGELATGLSVLTALPPGSRGIVTRLSAEYLKKARGPLTAVADVRALGLEGVRETTEVSAVAEISDRAGQVVTRVTAQWRIGR